MFFWYLIIGRRRFGHAVSTTVVFICIIIIIIIIIVIIRTVTIITTLLLLKIVIVIQIKIPIATAATAPTTALTAEATAVPTSPGHEFPMTVRQRSADGHSDNTASTFSHYIGPLELIHLAFTEVEPHHLVHVGKSPAAQFRPEDNLVRQEAGDGNFLPRIKVGGMPADAAGHLARVLGRLEGTLARSHGCWCGCCWGIALVRSWEGRFGRFGSGNTYAACAGRQIDAVVRYVVADRAALLPAFAVRGRSIERGHGGCVMYKYVCIRYQINASKGIGWWP